MNLGKLNCQCNYWMPTPLLYIDLKLSANAKKYPIHKCDFIDFMTPLCIMLCGVLTLLTKNRCYLQKSRVKLILRARKCSYPVFQSTTAISTTRVSKEWVANSHQQSMTCDLVFWVAAPATPQTKIPPHPQPRATCIFDGHNLQAKPQFYYIHIVPHFKACNFSFNFYSIIHGISQKWIIWVKKCFNCLNP